jgi:transposase-like protein
MAEVTEAQKHEIASLKHAIAQFRATGKHGAFPPSLRQRVVALRRQGLKHKYLCETLQLAKSMLYAWSIQAKNGDAGNAPKAPKVLSVASPTPSEAGTALALQVGPWRITVQVA